MCQCIGVGSVLPPAMKFACRAAAVAVTWLKMSHPGGETNPLNQRPPWSKKKSDCVQAVRSHPGFLLSYLV